MSTETTALRILLTMKRFINTKELIWTGKMISEAIRESEIDTAAALRFLVKNGYASSITTHYDGVECTEYEITSEGHAAVDDAKRNPRSSSREAEWIARARSGFNTQRRQSSLSRVAIPSSTGIQREEERSMEEYLDSLRENETWSDRDDLQVFER